MRKYYLLVTTIFSAGLILVLPGEETNPGAFALDPGSAQTGRGAAGTARIEAAPFFANPGQKVVLTGVIFSHDDGTAEIHTGSATEPLVVANRFVPGGQVILSSVSFYTSGAAAGDPAEIIVYEDPSGQAPAPDTSMEVFSTEITLGEGGFQVVEIGELMLNAAGSPEAAFFVGLINVSPRSFSLGIDISGTRGDASFISENGGHRFVPISEFPIIDGNAMIRAHRAGTIPFGHAGAGPLRDRIRARVRMGEAESFLHIGSSSEGARGEGTRATLINDSITASSGSGSCPGCTPALTPGYPMFTVGNPDLYEDYMTIENASGSGIAMPIRTVLGILTPGTVEAFNPDGGGTKPPDGYWEYSLSHNDGTTSADNVLDPGEKITRKWQIADDGGSAFSFWVDVYSGYGADGNTVLLLHGDGDGSASEHTLESHIHPMFDATTKKLGSGSMYFDGSGDYLTIPDSDDWEFGIGSFTVDAWIYPVILGSGYRQFLSHGGQAPFNGWGFYVYEDGRLGFGGFGVWEIASAAGTITTDTWQHVAVVRNVNGYKLFKDGQEVALLFRSESLEPSTESLKIGMATSYPNNSWHGHLDELRISKGIARWTADFTPPAGPYGPDAETKLLLHFDGDESDSAHSATIVGDTKIVASQSKWNGSFYFDGNGDYLTIPDSEDLELGSGDFTIDCWVNFSTVSMTRNFISKKSGPSGPPWDNGYLFGISNGTIRFLGSTSGSVWDLVFQDGISISTSTWYHFAAVRSGSEFKYYIDGVQIGTTRTVSESLFNNTGDFRVGSIAGYGEYMYGYLDEVRVSKGVARWTSNFTPPTEPY